MTSGTVPENTDPYEISKFDTVAAGWWDPEGELKTLHHINPIRLQYIEKHAGGLENKTVADIGCGGGILSESMAQSGANVTAIDASEKALQIARLHQKESGITVEYIHSTAEALVTERAGQFDVVTCMELLEHVPEPSSLITACSALTKPGGLVFFSTLNRTLKAYTLAVLGAEYMLGLLPKGTHQYAKFLRPSELAYWMRTTCLELQDLSGMAYNPVTQEAFLTSDIKVNYLICAQKLDD